MKEIVFVKWRNNLAFTHIKIPVASGILVFSLALNVQKAKLFILRL